METYSRAMGKQNSSLHPSCVWTTLSIFCRHLDFSLAIAAARVILRKTSAYVGIPVSEYYPDACLHLLSSHTPWPKEPPLIEAWQFCHHDIPVPGDLHNMNCDWTANTDLLDSAHYVHGIDSACGRRLSNASSPQNTLRRFCYQALGLTIVDLAKHQSVAATKRSFFALQKV